MTGRSGSDQRGGRSRRRATCFDLVVVSALAVGGVLMTPLALPYVLLVLAIAGVVMVLMEPLKVVVL
ncbi:MAG TPA: hypothetical protein VIJ44_07050 [Acidimicrobiia bacterium]